MKNLVIPVVLVALLVSCARVGYPKGGAKDETPPKVVKSYPDSLAVNIPTDLKELRVYFDEYVMLRDPLANLIITPPLKKIKRIIPSNLANKYVSIKWEDSLRANTTYNFNFGNSIIDHNEGNPLPYYGLAFSTGPVIDSIYVSGFVTDLLIPASEDKNPDSDKERDIPAVVGLYEASDKDFSQKPYYINKVDNDGYFELNYVSPGKYILLAFEDQERNSVYDQKSKVAFLKDTLNVDGSITGIRLGLSLPKMKPKYKEIKSVMGGVQILFEGNPEEVEVAQVGDFLSPEEFKITHFPKSDSVNIWIKPQDSAKVVSAQQLKFSYKTPEKSDTLSVLYRPDSGREFLLSNNSGYSLHPGRSFQITANEYINEINTEKWSLKSDSLEVGFKAEVSKKNPFQIIVSASFKEGKQYELSVPKQTVSSFFTSNEKAFIFNFEAGRAKDYGSLRLNLKSPPNHEFWLQLLDEQNQVAYQQKISNGSSVDFKYLKPGAYALRILVDNNANGQWDGVDLDNWRQPEDVYTYPKRIEVRPSWELVETWDLKSNSVVPSSPSTAEKEEGGRIPR